MCCKTNQSEHHNCGCSQGVMHHPEFWSKKRKISFLNECLTHLEEKVKDVKETLEELQS